MKLHAKEYKPSKSGEGWREGEDSARQDDAVAEAPKTETAATETQQDTPGPPK